MVTPLSFKRCAMRRYPNPCAFNKLGNPNAAKVGHLGGKVGSVKADEFAWEMKPLIEACRKVGIVSFTAISNHLNEIGKTTRRDGKWHPATVRQLLARIEKLTEARNADVHGLGRN